MGARAPVLPLLPAEGTLPGFECDRWAVRADEDWLLGGAAMPPGTRFDRSIRYISVSLQGIEPYGLLPLPSWLPSTVWKLLFFIFLVASPRRFLRRLRVMKQRTKSLLRKATICCGVAAFFEEDGLVPLLGFVCFCCSNRFGVCC